MEEQLCKFILAVISQKGCSERNRRDEKEIEHVELKVFVIGLIENVCSPYSRDPDRSNNEEGYEVAQKLITLAHDVLNKFALARDLTSAWYFE